MSEDVVHEMDKQLNISKRWLYIPMMIGILLMLPRICSAEFGFLDDAGVLVKSRNLINGEWNQLLEHGNGRFRPFYWLYPTLIFSLVHLKPEWYFIGNLLLLVGTTASILILANRVTGSRFIALWSGIFFVLSGPVIENYYTLSKGEPLQIAWILISLLALGGFSRLKSRKSRGAFLGLLVLLTLLAITSKETSLVMVPISIIWFMGTLIHRKYTKEDLDWKVISTYLVSTVVAAGIYFVLRMILLPINFPEDGYTSNFTMDITRFFVSLKQWERWIRRDFFYLAPLIFIPIFNLIRNRRIEHKMSIFTSLVWMIGWVFVFLPWIYQVEYYLLPFAAGSSLLGGTFLHQTIMVAKRGGNTIRLFATLFIVLAAFLFIATLPINLTNARLQLTVDENNAAMLSFVVDELPANSTLLINIQEPYQYVNEIKIWISEIKGRSDLNVENYQYQTFDQSDDQNQYYYIASPYLDNQYYRSVRLGFGEALSKKWDKSMLSFVGESADIVYETYGEFGLSIVDIRFGCLFIDEPAYCDIPTVPIDNRLLTYGWRVYRIPITH